MNSLEKKSYKTLLFSFYIDKNVFNNPINKMHFYYLKLYSNIFDEAIFILNCDDQNDTYIIPNVEKEIINCGFKNVQFIVEQSTIYRESYALYKYYYQNIRNFDGLLFFAHNKGISNIYSDYFDNKMNLFIIIGLYYFLSLEFVDEVERNLIEYIYDSQSYFYGPLLHYNESFESKNHCWYFGSFFWVNSNSLIRSGNLDDNLLCDRSFSELFPGNNCIMERMTSHNRVVIYDFDFYKTDCIDNAVRFVLNGDEEINKFYDLYNHFIDEEKISF